MFFNKTGRDIAALLHYFTYLWKNMNKLNQQFRAMPNEAKVFATAFGLFILAATLYTVALYLEIS